MLKKSEKAIIISEESTQLPINPAEESSFLCPTLMQHHYNLPLDFMIYSTKVRGFELCQPKCCSLVLEKVDFPHEAPSSV